MDTTKGRDFENTIAELFQTLGWNVQQNVVMSAYEVDIYADRKVDGLTVRIAIECKASDRPLGHADIQEIAGRVGMLRNRGVIDKTVIVSKAGFSVSAKTAADVYHIDCIRYEDLLERVIDFSPYLRFLANAPADREIAESFINPTLADKQGRRWPALQYIDQWVSNPNNHNLAILGDAGSGKTVLCEQVAARLAKSVLSNRQSTLVPVLIPLRQYRTAFGMRQVIVDHLTSYGVRIPTVAVLDRLFGAGGVVLILDGLDEMSREMGPAVASRAFWEIADTGWTRSRILLTSRTQFFVSQGYEREILEGGTDPITATLSNRPVFEVVYIRPWQQQHVHEYIRHLDPNNAEEIEREIDSTYDLHDLASRPALLRMIIKTLPHLKHDRSNLAALYRGYVDALIERDAMVRKMSLKAESIRRVLQEIAWDMVINDRLMVESKVIFDQARAAMRGTTEDETQEVIGALSTLPILSRDAEGNYMFTHKSFMEYLAAERAARASEEPTEELPKEVEYFRSQLLGRNG